MATLADPTWVEYWLELGDVHVLDPRPSLDYNRGHLPGAVNVPLERLFDERGALLPDEALGAVFGKAGVDESKRSLVYDGADGRRGALMAWTLEYLGRGEVSLSALLFEGWAQQGYPFPPSPRLPPPANSTLTSTPTSGPPSRSWTPPILPSSSTCAAPRNSTPPKTDCPAHPTCPGPSFLAATICYLRPDSDLARRLSNLGIGRMDKVVTYSTTGARAAIGYLALKRAGYDVRVLPNLL